MKTSLRNSVPSCLLFLFIACALLSQASLTKAQSGVMRPRTSAPPPSHSTVQATGQSSVKGRVFYKDNAQPLKGTRVRIFTSSDEGVAALTNDRGEFRVDNLAAGKYYVTLQGKGVAMQSGFGMRLPLPMTAIPRAEDYPEIVPKHDAQFTVDGTNTVEVEVRVARGGTISGKVLKANGAPVPSVGVSFISREGSGGGPYTARFSAQTDKDGAYKIDNLPEGEYVVAASTQDKNRNFDIRARMRGESQVVTYHPAAINIQQAQVVRVDPGRETAGVNITLVARNSFGVSGTVLRQRDGTALAGVRVLLRNKESETGGALVPGMGQRTTFTDADGRWSFGNVMEGAYVVSALAPLARSPARSRLPGEEPDREQLFRESRQRFLMAHEELTVAGADLNGLLLTISGPGSIVGRVETDDGTPLPLGLVMFLELISKGSRPGPPLPVRVRPDGTFNFSNVQGGDVYVGVVTSPDSKYFVKSIDANGDDPGRTPLKITEGTDAGPLRVVISQGMGTVNGRVLSENGTQGVSDIVVLLAPVESEKQRFRTAYLSTRTSSDGTFSIAGTPGEYFVFARQRDELPPIMSGEFVRSAAAKALRVTLKAGEQQQIDVRVQ
jgi:hypothetical protein